MDGISKFILQIAETAYGQGYAACEEGETADYKKTRHAESLKRRMELIAKESERKGGKKSIYEGMTAEQFGRLMG